MKYCIKTFGCQMNYSDSERVASMLEKYGFKPCDKLSEAGLVVFNTCGVRQAAEDKVYGFIHNLTKRKSKPTIILTGCLSNRKDVQRRMKEKVDLFTEIKSFEKDFQKFQSSKCSNSTKQYLKIIPKYQSKFSAYVPVMTGCNNFCSYCVVPYARGKEISRPVKEIIREIRDLIKKDYKEIVLVGQNVNSYKDGKINFAKLLKKVQAIPGDFWMGFFTSHPKDISQELIDTLTSLPKMNEYIHLPIQSGSNEVLRKMNRGYTTKHYLDLIYKIEKGFKKNKPDKIYSIASDIIVGFPGETKKQFSKSANVMRKVAYDMVYFGQYSPRPGTPAWKMKDNVSKKEKKRREKYLTTILRKSSLKNGRSYVGKIFDVLIDSERDGFYFGRTRTYKNIRVSKTKNDLVGKVIKVKIAKANAFNLEGDPTDNKIIVILGPTASGKSDVAIKLARRFNGEIISADSRQIYRGMDIGSGKVTKKEQRLAPHHMLDIVSPKTNYNVAKFKKKTEKIIKDILKKGKVPIICGGTGFWIKALVDDVAFPEVKPDWKLRKKLEKKSSTEISTELKKIDPERWKTIDKNNKVRMIRAIEIAKTLGSVPRIKKVESKYEFLQIGIDLPKNKLQKRIQIRLDQRLKQGMLKEVASLHSKNKVSWRRLEQFGLEYRWVSRCLQGKISKEEMREKLYFDITHYAKRQMTWFNKDKRIKWMKDYKKIKKEVKDFL